MGFLIASAIISVIAIGVSTYVAVQSAEQQANEAKAIRQEREAEAANALQTAAFEEKQHRRRMELLLGKQQAITAAAGLSTGSGSPLFAEMDLTTQAELDALQIRRGGQLEADTKKFEARMAKYREETIRGTIPWTIASGVLSAASSASSSYYTYQSSQTGSAKTVTGRMRSSY